MTMIYATIAIVAIGFILYLRSWNKNEKYVRGQEPYTISYVIDIPFDEYQKYLGGFKDITFPGTVLRKEQLSDTVERFRAYREPDVKGMQPSEVVKEVLLETIGGTEASPIRRLIEEDGVSFPRGENHYIVEIASLHTQDQTLATYEERGHFSGLFHFLSAKRAAETNFKLTQDQTVERYRQKRLPEGD